MYQIANAKQSKYNEMFQHYSEYVATYNYVEKKPFWFRENPLYYVKVTAFCTKACIDRDLLYICSSINVIKNYKYDRNNRGG